MKKKYINIQTGEIVCAGCKGVAWAKFYRSAPEHIKAKNIIDYDIFKIVCKD